MGVEGESTQSVDAGDDAEINLNIRCSNGNKFSVRATLRSTVVAFKDLLAQKCEVPANRQTLIYKGRILKDDQTLDSYGLQADHTIHMMGGSAPEPTTVAPESETANTPFQGGLGGLGGFGASNVFGSGLPLVEHMQQQFAQNPNLMRDMMNMQSVENILNNKEIMRDMIMINPQMRELIDRNPELAHILNNNDSAALRQRLEAARNPELMREMRRNTDRAMSNIESFPGGFNMLRRMHENVIEPFWNASTTGGNDSGLNPFAALHWNQSAVNNSSAVGSEATPGTAAPNSNPLPNPWGGTAGSGQTNTGTIASNISGLGGPGLPGLNRPTGIPDMSQLMQNPANSQMTQSLLSDPQYTEQILNQNSQIHGMFNDPHVREMMQNQEILRRFSPQMMQEMISLRQLLRDNTQTGVATGAQNNMGLDLLMNMFGGLKAGGLAVPSVPDVPTEQLYATQLSQLQEMGFFDTQENIRALRATAGNVRAAVERLLGNFGP